MIIWTRTPLPDLAQPLGEQRHVEDQDHVGGAERLERALALADVGTPTLVQPGIALTHIS